MLHKDYRQLLIFTAMALAACGYSSSSDKELNSNLNSSLSTVDNSSVVSGESAFVSISVIVVTFIDGLDETKVEVKPGDHIEPIAVERDGFELVGWFREPEFENEFDFENDVVVESISLYAKWELLFGPVV